MGHQNQTHWGTEANLENLDGKRRVGMGGAGVSLAALPAL